MIQGTIIEVSVRARWNNVRDCFNIQRLRIDTVGGVTDSQAVTDMTAYCAAIIGQQDDIQTTIIKYMNHILSEIYPNPRYISDLVRTSSQGSLPTDPFPIGVCISASQKTATYRRVGHKYFAGVSKAHVTDGQLTATCINETNQTMAVYCSAYSTSGRVYTPVIWSPTKLTSSPIVSYLVNPIPSYLVRRKPRN